MRWRRPPERNPDSLVDLPLPIQTLVHPRFAKQRDRALLNDSSPYPAENVLAALPLQHDAVDSPPMQKLGQQETGGAGADDSYLCFHYLRLLTSRKRGAPGFA